MTTINPKNQTTDTIVESLLNNTSKQYTESAHAEIFSRLISTMKDFNNKTERYRKGYVVSCGCSSGTSAYTDRCCDTVIEV